MVSINLGNVVGNRFVGISSGLDTETLITELSAVQQRPIDSVNDEIDLNNSVIGEYSTLRTLVNNLKSATDFLRNPSGVSNSFANIFNYRVASFSSSTLTPSSFLSASVAPGALVGETDIEIGNIAKALEERSGSFNSRNTTATTTDTGSYFTAGTFEIGSGLTTSVTGSSDDTYALVAGDYTVDGAGKGILGTGISNIVVTGGSGGSTSLQGGPVNGFQANFEDGDITLTVSINDVTYTSNVIPADTSINAGANTGIDFAVDGTITFTADSGGDNETSFDVVLNQDIIIDDDPDNVVTFLNDLETGLEDQTVFQSREISNFVDADVKSPLTGLANSNIKFYSDSFDAETGEFGEISNFVVKESTGSDGAISVEIDGETFRATGLGTTLNANITLSSTTTDKELQINLGDAAISVDLADSTDAQDLERSLGYAFGTRELVDYTVTEGDTLNDIAFGINQLSSQTGLSASIIQVDEFDFRLSIKATSEGIENSYEFFDAGGVLTNASVSTIQAAEDSLLRVDGIEISRSTNTVTDALENVTLNLLQVTPDYNEVSPESILLDIDNDIDTVQGGIEGFLNAYNALKVYDSEQNERDPSTLEFVEEAILGGDTILGNLLDQIGTEAFATVDGVSSTSFNALSDVGIEVQDFAGDDETIATNNILTFDENSLQNALQTNFNKVREVFEFNLTSSSNNLSIFTTSNSATISEFQLDIDLTRDAGEEVQLLDANGLAIQDSEGADVYLEYSDGRITAQTGTDIEGFEFVYIGTSAETVSVSFTQGIADRLYNIADSYTAEDGLIDTQVEVLTEKNDDFDDELLTLQDRLDSFVDRLRGQFSSLEAALQGVNNILTFLDADAAARDQS